MHSLEPAQDLVRRSHSRRTEVQLRNLRAVHGPRVGDLDGHAGEVVEQLAGIGSGLRNNVAPQGLDGETAVVECGVREPWTQSALLSTPPVTSFPAPLTESEFEGRRDVVLVKPAVIDVETLAVGDVLWCSAPARQRRHTMKVVLSGTVSSGLTVAG